MIKLDDWIFKTEEISAGFYKVKGTDKFGRSVEKTGTDPDKLLEGCKNSAREIMKEIEQIH